MRYLVYALLAAALIFLTASAVFTVAMMKNIFKGDERSKDISMIKKFRNKLIICYALTAAAVVTAAVLKLIFI